MTVSDYLYEAKGILETVILTGVTLRAIQTVLVNGLEQGDWYNAWQKIKKLVLVAIISVGVAEFVFLLKDVYFGG